MKKLNFFDSRGAQILCMDLGNLDQGIHSVETNISNLKSDYYFYAITLDGERSEYRKMIVK